MKHALNNYPGLIGKIQGRLQAAKDAETPELRNDALDKAIRQVELLGNRLAKESAFGACGNCSKRRRIGAKAIQKTSVGCHSSMVLPTL